MNKLLFVDDNDCFCLNGESSSRYKIRNYSKRDVIYYEGDEPYSVFYILEGNVKTKKTRIEDKDFVMEIFGKNEFLGYISLLDNGPYPDSAVAINDVSVAIIPKEEFLAIVYNDPIVSQKFVKMLAGDIRDKEERMLTLAFNSVRARVAGALLHLQKKNHNHNLLDSIIRISRDDLAGLIGTTTESLIRTLKDFKQEELIKTKVGEIKILNKEALEKVRMLS